VIQQMGWICKIAWQNKEQIVRFQSDKLAKELSEAIASGEVSIFAGHDEATDETIRVDWTGSVSVSLRREKELATGVRVER